MEKIGIFLSLFFIAFNGCSKNPGSLELINQSGGKIASGYIKVCNAVLNIPELSNNEKTSFKFELCSDDHYRVSVKLASGDLVEQEVGYVSSVSHLVDSIIVKSDHIEYRNEAVKY